MPPPLGDHPVAADETFATPQKSHTNNLVAEEDYDLVSFKVEGSKCAHYGCQADSWAICEVCSESLCSVHMGLNHRGAAEHPEFLNQSGCHEHALTTCANCPCRQCCGKAPPCDPGSNVLKTQGFKCAQGPNFKLSDLLLLVKEAADSTEPRGGTGQGSHNKATPQGSPLTDTATTNTETTGGTGQGSHTQATPVGSKTSTTSTTSSRVAEPPCDPDKAVAKHHHDFMEDDYDLVVLKAQGFKCAHCGCEKDSWAICEVCSESLCGVHMGLNHRGGETHPEFHQQPRCHDHQITTCANCCCRQCCGSRTAGCGPLSYGYRTGSKASPCDQFATDIKKDETVSNERSVVDASACKDDTLAQIKAQFRSKRRKCISKAVTRDDAIDNFLMHVRLALLLKRGAFASVRALVERCTGLAVSRPKLSRVLRLLQETDDHCLQGVEFPAEFEVGRFGDGQLTRSQKFDILRTIESCERANFPLPKPKIDELVCSYKLVNEGIEPKKAKRLGQVKHICSQLLKGSSFQNYRRRMNQMFPRKRRFKIRRSLKGITKEEASRCTPTVVTRMMTKIIKIFAELEFLTGPEQAIKEESADLICWCDEKGVDERNMNSVQAVCTGQIANNVTCEIAPCSFGHISICGFISWAGTATKPTTVVTGVRTHKDLSDIWSGKMLSQKKGAFTSEHFSTALEEWHTQLPEYTQRQWKFLGMDRGGGTWMHIAHPKISQWLLQNSVRAFIQDKYKTKSNCPLDQKATMASSTTAGWSSDGTHPR